MQKTSGVKKIAKKTKNGFTWREYVQYLRSDKWRMKRLALAYQRGFTCERCGCVCKDKFEVHHKTYKHAFREPLVDLMLLCPECHRMIEAQKRRDRKWGDVRKQRHNIEKNGT